MNDTRAPNAPNDDVKEYVLEQYRKGKKPKALAEKTGVSVNTIKSWLKREKAKTTQGLDKTLHKESDASSNEKGASSKRKAGAPAGNKNAKGNRGGSAPPRNKNAERHGAYSKIYWDALEAEELDMLELFDVSEEQELEMQIQMFAVRERRLMRRIREYKEIEKKNHGLAIVSVQKTKKTKTLLDEDGELTGNKLETEDTQTKTEAILNSIMALESELTKIQKAKTKAIESLAKIRNDRGKLTIEEARERRSADRHALELELLDAQIESIDANTQKVLGENVEMEDISDTDAMIYGGAEDAEET